MDNGSKEHTQAIDTNATKDQSTYITTVTNSVYSVIGKVFGYTKKCEDCNDSKSKKNN
jgi:hypothetical protein